MRVVNLVTSSLLFVFYLFTSAVRTIFVQRNDLVQLTLCRCRCHDVGCFAKLPSRHNGPLATKNKENVSGY